MLEERALRFSRQNNRLRTELQELFNDVTANKPRASRDRYSPIAEEYLRIGVKVRGRVPALIRILVAKTCSSKSAFIISRTNSAKLTLVSNRVSCEPWSHRLAAGLLPLAESSACHFNNILPLDTDQACSSFRKSLTLQDSPVAMT